MGKPCLPLLFLLFFILQLLAPAVRAEQVPVLYAEIDSSISPAQADFLEDVLVAAREGGAKLVLIRLDTPGGLGETMRVMVGQILNSPVPVGVWVGPAGAHAASAGVFLVAAADVAAMHPQSTIGAASPVGIGGEDVNKTMAEKVKNDITSLVRAVAQARGRNIDWYVRSVEEAVSIPGPEAYTTKVVDFLASSPMEFLEQAGRIGIRAKTGEPGEERFHFSKDEVQLTDFKGGFRHRFLSWLLDPQVAYFLLLGGILGLFFEMATPGAVLPGVLGGICFLLGLYALSILPTNAAGLLLILFAAVLFVLELFITSYALLSIAGLASLFIGSTILFRSGAGIEPLSTTSVEATVVTMALFVLAGAWLTAQAQLRRPRSGLESLAGLPGEVMRWEGDKGQIRVRGEIWFARTEDGQPLSPGTKVSVLSVDGLTLTVRPEKHVHDPLTSNEGV